MSKFTWSSTNASPLGAGSGVSTERQFERRRFIILILLIATSLLCFATMAVAVAATGHLVASLPFVLPMLGFQRHIRHAMFWHSYAAEQRVMRPEQDPLPAMVMRAVAEYFRSRKRPPAKEHGGKNQSLSVVVGKIATSSPEANQNEKPAA